MNTNINDKAMCKDCTCKDPTNCDGQGDCLTCPYCNPVGYKMHVAMNNNRVTWLKKIIKKN